MQVTARVAALRHGLVVAGALGLLALPALAASAALGACAADDPRGAAPDDGGGDAPFLGETSPPDGEAGVPAGDVCGDATGLEPSAPWPMRGGCPKRAGVSATTGPSAATVKWSLPLAAGDSSPAIGADHVLWIGTSDGDVLAVSQGGAIVGALRTGGAVRSSPARSATGLTVVGGLDGKLYGVVRTEPVDAGADAGDDGGDGGPSPNRAAWTRTLAPITSSPAIAADGTIYVGTNDGKLLAVAGDGSATQWSTTTNDTTGSSPVIASDGTIYVGSSDKKLYAIAPDGKVKWTFDTGGAISGSPAVGGDETVYVGSGDGKLYAVTPEGKARWTYTTGGPITGSPAVLGGTVYVGSDDQKLHAVFTPTGAARWTYPTLGAVGSPVIASDETVYVGSADGTLYGVKPSGLLYFAVKVKGKIHSAPALSDDETLYVTTDTALVAIGR